MRKFLLCSLLSLAGLCFPQAAAAQFIGYVSPQTVQQTLATGTACTGAAQIFPVSNLGQTQHFATVIATGQPITFQMEIDGIDKQGNVFRISDIAMLPNSSGSLSAAGYYPKIQIVVTCTPGTATFTLSYSGASATIPVNDGSYLFSRSDKILFNGAPANAGASITSFQTPFANSSGNLVLNYTGGSVAGSTLVVFCQTSAIGSNGFQTTYTVANSASVQTFSVPAFSCPVMTVTYNSGGATASFLNLEYFFTNPGFTPNAGTGTYTHVTGTTATAAKTTSGFLHTLTVNTGGAGTISVFDLPTASCTGTPATNTVAVITATAATLQTFTYDVNMLQGICVKASVAMDFTVSSN